MPVRKLVILLAAAGIAGAVSAEPTKPPAHSAGQPAETKRPVIVASAEMAASAAAPTVSAESESAPPKRVRTARVSTCRCGSQTPTEE